MAKMVNVNPGMTTAEAIQVGGRNSWMGDGAAYFSPEQDMPLDLAPIEEGSSALTVPDISEAVNRWSKDGIISQINRGILQGKVRDTRGRYGDPKEWDHISITFTRDESARLRELGPEAIERVRLVVGDALRRAPNAPNFLRQMVMSRLHESTGNFHFHALIHRHGISRSPDGKAVEASTSIDMIRNSEIQSIVLAINTALQDAGLGEFRILEAGVGENDVFANRGDAPRSLSDSEGQQADRGPDPGQSLLEQARTLTPSETALRQMVAAQEKKVAEARKALEDAERLKEGFLNVMAAEVQKNEALRLQRLAEDRAEIAEAKAVEADARSNEAVERQRVAEENLRHEQARAEKAERDADAAQRAQEATEQRLYEANAKLGDQEEALGKLKEDLEHEQECRAEAEAQIAELEASSKQLQETSSKLQTDVMALEEKLAKSEAMVAELNGLLKENEAKMVAERAAMEQRKAKELADLQAGLEARHAQEVAVVRGDVEQKIELAVARADLKSAEKMTEVLQSHTKTIELKDQEIKEQRGTIEELRAKVTEISSKAQSFLGVLRGSLRGIFKWRIDNKIIPEPLEDIKSADAIVSEFMDARKEQQAKANPNRPKPPSDDDEPGPGQR